MALCGAFALLGFPSDDLWHEIFGQDVTLWGPTHLILLTGGQLTIVCILGLLVEGRVAARRSRPGGLPRRGRLAVAVSGAGGILAGLTVYQAEFGFGVPQYRLLFQPVLLAFSGALALVMARRVAGRGGALAAVAFYVVVSAAMALFVGPVMGRSVPHFPTYLAAAVCIEVAAVVKSQRGFVLLSGVLVGVVGTLGEWGWSHVWMPIPWPADFVPGAIAVSVPAALCGAFVGAFIAACLKPRPPGEAGEAAARPWLPAALGMIGLGVIIAALVPNGVPAGSSATVSLAPDGNAVVRFRPAALADGAHFVQELAWQGGTRSVQAPMRRIQPGVYRTTKPLPTSGEWKALIRLQNGSTLADLPVYLPADPAIPARGIPARPHFTRPLVSDSQLMQRERKRDVPGWLWAAGIASVMSSVAILLAILGWSLNRVARRAATPHDRRSDVTPEPDRRPRAFDRRSERAARSSADPARNPRPAA
jgi:hypothetical protein